YAWGLNNLAPGDVVVVSELEHHSNFVPWQYIAGRAGAKLAMIPLTEEGELDLSALDGIAAQGNIKVVATNQVSNSLGTINPVEKLVAWAHEQGAIFVCDAAQSAPHINVDVQTLGADFVASIGFDAIEAHEHELAAYALGRLADIPGITLYGPPAERRAGIVSFNIDGVHPHDVAQILDMQGVAIRAGHHCCQPLMQKLGVAATNRASFYLYTVQEEIDQLVDGLHTVHKVFA